MSIKDIFGRFFNKNDTFYNSYTEKLTKEIYYKELAIASAINIIAKMIANSEFRTYKQKKEVFEENYYRFNIEPNQNQNATEFWQEVIWKLYYENEALIIKELGMYYLADSFTPKDKTLYQTSFENVKVKELIFNKTYYMEDVFYLKLNNSKIKELLDNVFNSYGELIAVTAGDYKSSRGIKGKVKLNTSWSQKFDDQTKLQNAIREKFKSYFSSENAVIPMEEGFDFTESEKKSSTNSEDIQKIIDGAINMVSIAFNMPRSVLKGELSEIKEETKNLFTFTGKPTAKLLQDEINRKLYGVNAYKEGSKMKIDISKAEYINMLDSTSSLDILKRNGFTHNELMRALGEEQIDEAWANKRYITKNYEEIKEGGKNEKK